MTTAEQAAANLFAGLEDDREGASQYLSIFIDEALSTLDELIEALLALETGGGKKQVDQLFVAAHRMKGSAASIGLNRIAKLSHLMEDLLQTLVDSGGTPTPQITDALLSCTDGLRQSVDALQSGQTADDRFPALAQELLAASHNLHRSATASPFPPPLDSPPCASPASAVETPSVFAAEISNDLRRRIADLVLAEQRDDVVVGQIVFETNLPLVSLKAQLLASKLANLGEIRYLNPSAEAMETLDEIAAVEFAVVTDKSAEVVHGLVQVSGVASVAVEPLERRQTPADARAMRRAKLAPPSPAPSPPRPCESTSSGSTS